MKKKAVEKPKVEEPKLTVVSWGPYLPGSKISQARMLLIDGKPTMKFERWEEDPSLDSVDQALQRLAAAGAITYERVKEEWPLG